MATNPYNNKVQLSDGTVLIDLTGDTVTPTDLLNGITAHNRSGEQITGVVNLADAATNVPSENSGAGSVGSSTKYAREDHKHPLNPGTATTTLADLISKSQFFRVGTTGIALGTTGITLEAYARGVVIGSTGNNGFTGCLIAIGYTSKIYTAFIEEGSVVYAKTVDYGTSTPLADSGTGSVGTATKYAREDHVHPSKFIASTITELTDLGNESKFFVVGSADIAIGSTGVTLSAYSRGIYINYSSNDGALIAISSYPAGYVISAFRNNSVWVSAKSEKAIEDTKVSGYGTVSALSTSDLESDGWVCPTDGIVTVMASFTTSGRDAYLYIRNTTDLQDVCKISTTDANGLSSSSSFPVKKNKTYKATAKSEISNYALIYYPFSYS